MLNDPPGVKVVVAGDTGVGKSALLKRMLEGTFVETQAHPTIGVEFRSLLVTNADHTYRLQLWDTAGQERFRSIAVSYFRGSQIALLVYSIDSHDALDALGMWKKEISNVTPAAFVVVGTKSDLADKAKEPVTREEARVKMAGIGLEPNETPFVETSARTGDGIHALKEILAQLAEKNQEVQQAALSIDQEVRPVSGCCLSPRH
jgi:small GTP-binding protein